MNIEHIPRQLFSGCIAWAAWCFVRTKQDLAKALSLGGFENWGAQPVFALGAGFSIRHFTLAGCREYIVRCNRYSNNRSNGSSSKNECNVKLDLKLFFWKLEA
jgi:hypothetical protein